MKKFDVMKTVIGSDKDVVNIFFMFGGVDMVDGQDAKRSDKPRLRKLDDIDKSIYNRLNMIDEIYDMRYSEITIEQ